MSRARGLRREAPILLPASLLLFAMLASVTLLSYRSAVARFAAEREQAILKLAGTLAEALRLAKNDDVAVLARWLPPGAALALYDGRGTLLESHGWTEATSAAPTSAWMGLGAPRLEGLDANRSGDLSTPPSVRALIPFSRAGQRYLLRVDVPEPALFAQRRSLAILTPVVFGLAIAVAALVIFFLRALMQPYEALLQRARAVAPAGGDAGALPQADSDDVEALLATFDRALAALRSESASGGERADGGNGARGKLGGLGDVERTLLPQLESGLLMFDRSGKLLAANPAAIELLGGSPAAALAGSGGGVGGQGSAASLAAPALAESLLASHPELARVVSTAIAAGSSIPRASVAIERAGRRLEVGLTLQRLRHGVEGDESGFLALFADITDLSRRESEERFASGLAQLGELSAGVAHELRNSLATVQGYLTLAARRALPPEASEEIAEARREAGELARVVDDFLTFARPGSGALESVDLALLLARATSDPAVTGTAGVAIHFAPPASALPAISGDPHLLQRALRNLLLNAVQATLALAARDGGAPRAVVVRLKLDGALASITIDDEGPGLAPEILSRLFEPFASGRQGGAGLGLALARRIVLMHGGTLTLAGKEPTGVRAEIRLPLGESDT